MSQKYIRPSGSKPGSQTSEEDSIRMKRLEKENSKLRITLESVANLR